MLERAKDKKGGLALPRRCRQGWAGLAHAQLPLILTSSLPGLPALRSVWIKLHSILLMVAWVGCAPLFLLLARHR